ncbi:hypothetical protein J2S17_004426 [Cytobacillus purgationiresistens]|uniref:Uncharacterized protein n=1 Tax=Cytobacillus purgationiresistens TaxID=863449 RepID=A0ABU0AMP1_9BACI|nr:hypothetical protein [Cytobacillus purgationiresistens]
MLTMIIIINYNDDGSKIILITQYFNKEGERGKRLFFLNNIENDNHLYYKRLIY